MEIYRLDRLPGLPPRLSGKGICGVLRTAPGYQPGSASFWENHHYWAYVLGAATYEYPKRKKLGRDHGRNYRISICASVCGV